MAKKMTPAKKMPKDLLGVDDDAYFAALDEDDSPEWTEEMFARARPGREILSPETLKSLRRTRGRPKKEKTRTLVSLRLDPDVLAHFQEEGEGWRGRIEETLAREAKRKTSAKTKKRKT